MDSLWHVLRVRLDDFTLAQPLPGVRGGNSEAVLRNRKPGAHRYLKPGDRDHERHNE